MTPLSLSGFNWDVVIENTASGPPYTSYAAELNPGEGRSFYQSGLPGKSYGLPATGSFVSATGDGTTFQLAPYTSNNALVLSSDTGLTSGTLTIAGPAIFNRVAILANSASGGGTPSMTLNFSDGSTFTTNYNAPDWFNNTGFALQGFERIVLSSGVTEGATTNPRFYQTTIDLSSLGAINRTLVSITFNKAAGAGSTAIYAISGDVAQQTSAGIVTSPTDLTLNELASGTFTAVPTGVPYPALQWSKNWVGIPGATNPTYSIGAAALADNGATFRLVASNMINGISYVATSSPAILTVIADTNPPVLLGAQTMGLTQVVARFSERLKPSNGTNIANYFISGTNAPVTISVATLDASQSNVVLTVVNLADKTFYTLRVSNVVDQSVAANVIAPNSQAQFVAGPYTLLAIGNPSPPGNQLPGGNGWDVSGGGTDLGGTVDRCQFSYAQVSGDFDVKVRLQGLSLADSWSEAGLLVREDLGTGSRSAGVLATPTISGCYFQSRNTTNGTTTLSGSFPVNYPNTWLRLKRSGTVINGYAGFDGQNWTQLGSSSMTMPTTLFLGFAVSSHNAAQTTTASFRDYSNVTSPGVSGPITFESLGQCSRRTSLVISEIMYHPTNSALEFVEIFNSRGEPQDMSGFSLGGSIHYVFPAGTQLPGGGFLVVAKTPPNLQNAYGLTGVLGPYDDSLPNDGGTVRLINQAGALLLEVNYSDKSPWPAAADGAGHSLVLARPSYGEGNPLAWAASANIGGSPGMLDPVRTDPLRNVVINEFLAHTDLPDIDYIELYNHSSQPVDISGCILSDDPDTNKFVIPTPTTIPEHGFVYFTETSLHFALNAAGETIYLKDPTLTRVLDSIRFDAQENGVAFGRYPDGADQFYRLVARTPGGSNAPIRINDIVINELMYHPISEDENDQYIELFNRGTNPVNLAGWELDDAVSFTLPTNTVLAAGGYLVIAKNAAQLIAHYPNLNGGNTLGDFSGKLSSGGERLALTMPDTIISTNSSGVTVTNLIHIAVDEVTYATGGRWPQWADGGGSSLELIDPRSNHRLPSNWGDSDETHKAPWTQISTTGTLDNGDVGADQLQVLLLGAGECLIDNVQVLTPLGTNLIANSTFETDASNWTAEGTEAQSGLETSEGFNSSKSYHIRAVDRGDNEVNRVRTPLTNSLPANTPGVTLRANVRWLKGHPELLLRLRGNWLECLGELALPIQPGTPGAPNSRLRSNAPPAITGVQHSPILPPTNQAIVVSAAVHDPDGLASVLLNYRLDPGSSYSSILMKDDGMGGDAVAGDGIFSATIPGQASASLVAFYVQATDTFNPAASVTFPSDAPARECLVRIGEVQPTGNFPVYRIWMTQATLNTWTSRNRLNNAPFDVTFVLGNQRVIYNAQALYAGSPYIAPGYCGPTCGRCGYTLSFPVDDPFLGETDLVLDWPGGHGNENTAMQEEMGYWIADRVNLPFSHRYIIRLHVNGVTDTARQTAYEAVMQPGKGFLKEWMPNDTDGQFFKIERAFEFSDGGGLAADPQPRLQKFTTTGGAKKVEKYRWNFLMRGATRENNYTNIFALVDAANATSPEPFTTATFGLMDVEECMGIFAMEHIIVNFDAYGHEIGKNMYAYLPENGKWQLYMFDLDWLMLAAQLHTGNYAPSSAPLFNSEDPTIARMYAVPPFARAYWRTIQNAVNGPLQASNCNPVMDAKNKSLVANGVAWCDGQALADPTAVKSWFSSRRGFLQSQLDSIASPFSVNPTITVNNGIGKITGTAPINVKTVSVNGVTWQVNWTTLLNWTLTVPLQPGVNNFSVVGVDVHNHPIAGASNAVSVVYNNSVPSPVGAVIFSEILFNPAVPDAQYVELFNTSSNFTFNLSGWQVNGLDYTFPDASFIAPRSSLVLAKSRTALDIAYGPALFVFDEYEGNLQANGETLSLLAPNGGPVPDLVVNRVRYEPNAPWPAALPGHSLQLIDTAQDNSRVGNWAVSDTPFATPGAANSVSAALPPFPTLWLNELQAENITGPTDNYDEHDPWIELYNPGPNPVTLDGLYLSDDYGNPGKWAFPSNIVLEPQSFGLVWCDAQTNQTSGNVLHANFRLGAGTGSIGLSRWVSNAFQVIDYLNYADVPANYSYGDIPDGQPFYRQVMHNFSPTGTNTDNLEPLDVAINEWMAENTTGLVDPATGKFEDWFELYNRSNAVADLAGFYLTDDLTNQFQFQIPAGYTIPPHGYLLVWADGKPSANTNPAALHVPFKLDKTGEAIGLFAPDGSAIDALTFGAQTANISEGRFPNGANARFFMPTPTPGASNVVPNVPPVLSPIANQFLTVGQTLTFTASASDSDQPAQNLTFSLGVGAPFGATINSSSGSFSWKPSAAGTYSIRVIVTDNGNPIQSASQTFTATVYAPPTILFQATGNQLQLNWPRGTLQEADNVNGPYTDIDAQPPYIVTADAVRKFYRVRL